MNFQDKLNNYARLLVKHGLNVQPNQMVNIGCEAYHRDLALLIAEESYKVGASFVNIDLGEPRLARARILHSQPDHLSFQPRYVTQKYEEFVSSTAASIRIVGMEDPDLLADLDPEKINRARMGQYQAVKNYYKEGIEKSAVHWTVAAAATEGWARRIFPGIESKVAESKLWDEIFKICRVDRSDYLEVWRDHNDLLHRRAKKLTELALKNLYFKGPGTDLRVGLSSAAIFKGGGDLSPLGVEFEPNIPTEECFTTPDARQTEGKVSATRPFFVNGRLIKGLILEFKGGEIVKFDAQEGRDTFESYINSDPGGRRLGEVALVGIDSPVFTSGLVFEEILFDENAACHIAVGSSYKFCLKNGANLNESELEELGANQSTVHTDIMISSQEVDVIGERYSGETLQLISKGEWQEI